MGAGKILLADKIIYLAVEFTRLAEAENRIDGKFVLRGAGWEGRCPQRPRASQENLMSG